MADDIYMTVVISAQEAQAGTGRILLLPNGQQVRVTIPTDAYDGQILWFPGYVKNSEDDAQSGTLLLTLQIGSPEQTTANDEVTLQADPAPTQSIISSQGASPDSDPPPSQLEVVLAPPPPPPVSGQQLPTPVAQFHTPTGTSRQRSLDRMVILIIATLLIIGGAGGAFLTVHNQQVTAQTNATATAVDVTSTSAAATAASQASDATATSIVSGTATAVAATATAQTQGTVTVRTANPNPYAGGTLMFYDPLDGTSEDSGDIAQWMEAKGCTFNQGALHALDNDPRYMTECPVPGTLSVKDFTLEVHATILRGDSAQIIFRGNSIVHVGYFFVIDGSGNYLLDRLGDASLNNSTYTTLLHGNSSAIAQGYNQSNTLAVVAQGSTITLYVNGQVIGSTSDTNFPVGEIDLVASNYSNSATKVTEVAFSKLRIWSM